MNFTHQNHIKYYIDGELYGYRKTPYDKFLVTVGQIDQDRFQKSSWLEEQKRTARLVKEDLGKDLVVFFSGGTDSEIVIRSFLRVGFTPRVCFVRFKNDYNIDDYKEAQKVADDVGIDLEVIDFDVVDFYRSGEAREFSSIIHCRQMAYLTVYYNMLKLGCPAVMGGDFFLRKYIDQHTSKWYFVFRENEEGSAMRFSLKYNLPVVNEWGSYTPEMMGYYLREPYTQWLINDPNNYKLANQSSKHQLLFKLFPGLIRKVKSTGYERLMGFSGETYWELQSCHTKRLEFSLDGIFIDDLERQLYGDYNVGN